MVNTTNPLLDVIDQGDVTVVRFTLDDAFLGGRHVSALTKEVTAIIAKHQPKTLQFDLTGVELLTGEVLGFFILIRASGVDVALYNPVEDVRRALTLTRLDKLFRISDV